MDGKPEHVAMEAVSRVPWAIIYKGKRPGSSVVDRTAEPKGGVIREGGGHRWYRFVAGVDRSGGEGEIAPYENLYLCPSPGRTDVSVFPRDALGCYRVDDGEGRDLYVEFSVHKCGNGRRGRGIRTSRLWPGRLLRRVLWDPFLPHGYPDSVPPDYFAFQFWDTVQGFCSYVEDAHVARSDEGRRRWRGRRVDRARGRVRVLDAGHLWNDLWGCLREPPGDQVRLQAKALETLRGHHEQRWPLHRPGRAAADPCSSGAWRELGRTQDRLSGDAEFGADLLCHRRGRRRCFEEVSPTDLSPHLPLFAIADSPTCHRSSSAVPVR